MANNPLRHSFAFRLGAAFAVVAFVGAGVTALAINAAFAARFDRYLQQQQTAQLDRVGSALAQAYAGNGKWNRRALAGLLPNLGSGQVRVMGPNGQDVWQWDGHSMSWDDHWMQGGSDHTGWSSGSGSGHGGQGSWSGNHHQGDGSGSWGSQSGTGGSGSGSGGWNSGSGWTDQGWSNTSASSTDQPIAMLALTRSAPAPSPAPSPTDLGPVQRIPIVVNGKLVGTALVRLPKPTALPDAIAFRAEVMRLLLLGGALGAMLSFGLGVIFARRATRPVREATGAARALAAGDRTVRLEAGRPDEFGEMGRAFNSMADAVDDEEHLRQAFAGEVAHELRTPLTILRSQVEGLRLGVLQPSPEALDSLDEEVQRMSRLVADLQILGSADAAGFSLERHTVDLREPVDEVVRQFAGLYEGSEVALETRLDDVTAWVDRLRIGQILSNLLSNALKFTPAGGIVRVELRAEDRWAVVRVADSGPGIPPDELPHVFDRFFRGRTTRASGSGIGLTVVRELVHAHGGSVEVSSVEGQGTTFTVRLPAEVGASATSSDVDATQPVATIGS